MFGDWGTLIVQFAVTAAIVLALVAAVFWFVRRYSTGSLGRIGRGRVPRLAVVDAMSVDGRRRLVLVRRDNVEHLILIGGPSDLVVEQAIQRPRRPKPATSPEADATSLPGTTPASTASPAFAPENQPIPFPQGRPQPLAAERAQGADRPFSFRRGSGAAQPTAAIPVARQQPLEEVAVPLSPARFVDLSRPTRIEPATATAQFQELPETEPLFPELPEGDLPLPPERAAAVAGNGSEAPAQPSLGLDDEMNPPEPSSFARPAREADDDTAAKVNDLEREMARLLGEITQKHPS